MGLLMPRRPAFFDYWFLYLEFITQPLASPLHRQWACWCPEDQPFLLTDFFYLEFVVQPLASTDSGLVDAQKTSLAKLFKNLWTQHMFTRTHWWKNIEQAHYLQTELGTKSLCCNSLPLFVTLLVTVIRYSVLLLVSNDHVLESTSNNVTNTVTTWFCTFDASLTRNNPSSD